MVGLSFVSTYILGDKETFCEKEVQRFFLTFHFTSTKNNTTVVLAE